MITEVTKIMIKKRAALAKKERDAEFLSTILERDDATFEDSFNAVLFAKDSEIYSKELFCHVLEKFKFPVNHDETTEDKAVLNYIGFKVEIPLSAYSSSSISFVPDIDDYSYGDVNEKLNSSVNAFLKARRLIDELNATYMKDKSPLVHYLFKKKTYLEAMSRAHTYIVSSTGEEKDNPADDISNFVNSEALRNVVSAMIDDMESISSDYEQSIDMANARFEKMLTEYEMILPAMREVSDRFSNTALGRYKNRVDLDMIEHIEDLIEYGRSRPEIEISKKKENDHISDILPDL